jgi:hypothetical protein
LASVLQLKVAAVGIVTKAASWVMSWVVLEVESVVGVWVVLVVESVAGVWVVLVVEVVLASKAGSSLA